MLHATCYMLRATCYMLHATCYMLSTHLACNNNVACCNCCNPICCFTPRWLPDNGQQWSTMVALVLFASQCWSTLVNNGEQSKRGGYGDSREETDKVGVSDLHSLNSFHHLSSDNTGYVISYSLISSFHHLMRKWAVSSFAPDNTRLSAALYAPISYFHHLMHKWAVSSFASENTRLSTAICALISYFHHLMRKWALITSGYHLLSHPSPLFITWSPAL